MICKNASTPQRAANITIKRSARLLIMVSPPSPDQDKGTAPSQRPTQCKCWTPSWVPAPRSGQPKTSAASPSGSRWTSATARSQPSAWAKRCWRCDVPPDVPRHRLVPRPARQGGPVTGYQRARGVVDGRAVPGGRRPLAGHHQPARLAVMRQKNWFPESKKR